MAGHNSDTKFGGPRGNKQGNGRPPLPADLKAAQRAQRDETISALLKIMKMTPRESFDYSQRIGATNTELIISSLIEKCIQEGCFMRAQFLFNYVIGKPLPIEETAENNANILVFKSSVKADGSIVQALLDAEESQDAIKRLENNEG